MVKNKIPVNRVAVIETLLVNSEDGEKLFYTHSGYQMPTPEEFVAKYKFEVVDGKLAIVEKL